MNRYYLKLATSLAVKLNYGLSHLILGTKNLKSRFLCYKLSNCTSCDFSYAYFYGFRKLTSFTYEYNVNFRKEEVYIG